MAQLDVQPKKRTTPWWLWLLLALVLLGIIFYLSKGCNKTADTAVGTGDSTTTATHRSGNDTGAGVTGATSGATAAGWDNIDFNSPAASYEEITDTSIGVRGGNGYAIYSLGENVLFETDKSAVKGQAESNLKQIASSLSKRFNGGQIRVYGYTDAEGSAGYNKQLAEQRAEAVKNWLVKNGQISEQNISLHPVGESRPVASNATEGGRQQNRRVEIVAKSNQ